MYYRQLKLHVDNNENLKPPRTIIYIIFTIQTDTYYVLQRDYCKLNNVCTTVLVADL